MIRVEAIVTTASYSAQELIPRFRPETWSSYASAAGAFTVLVPKTDKTPVATDDDKQNQLATSLIVPPGAIANWCTRSSHQARGWGEHMTPSAWATSS